MTYFSVKQCAFQECENEFVPSGPRSAYCDKTHLIECSETACSILFKTKSCLKPETRCPSCVREQAQIKREISQKKTFMEKYDVAWPMQSEELRKKAAQTLMDKHNVSNPSQSDAVKAKKKETFQKHYGVNNPSQIEEIKNKKRKTTFDHYGVEVPAQSEEIRNRMKDSSLEKYGVEHPWSSPLVQEKIKETNLLKYGVEHVWSNPDVRLRGESTMEQRYGNAVALRNEAILLKAQETMARNFAEGVIPHERVSKINRNYADLLRNELSVEVLFEQRLGRFNADLHLAGTSIFLEINPTISHNSLRAFICVKNGCPAPCPTHAPLSINYHFLRGLEAQARGQTLIQVYDWNSEEEVVDLVKKNLNKQSWESKWFNFNHHTNLSLKRAIHSGPALVWSKKKETVVDQEGFRKNLLEEGYYPVWTAGQVLGF